MEKDSIPAGKHLADVYEILKRHETALRDLAASTEAITSFWKASGGDPFGKIEESKQRLLLSSKTEFDNQLRLFDETIDGFSRP
jgi:hypothetical protein